jgi:hypothetical protein
MSTAIAQRVSITAPDFKYFAEFPEGFRPGIPTATRSRSGRATTPTTLS